MNALVIDDDPAMQGVLEVAAAAAGLDATTCATAEEAWQHYETGDFSLVLVDWMLPGIDGVELCRRMRAHALGQRTYILVVTARRSADDLQAVLDAGADDYIAKPVDPEVLRVRIAIAIRAAETILARERAESSVRQKDAEIEDLRKLLTGHASFHDLVGGTPEMREVYDHVRDFAGVDWTVLIHGETGTGKELVARAIHHESPRRDRPFVPVNCAGLSVSLLQSQLFGHKRGAFTGASTDHAGFFEAASGGTLFLDEIGDVAPEVQTALLRVLEEHEITRVGESQPRKVDVRVIAATHRDLQAEVDAGKFRADLMYRIRIARISLPPLRRRRGDIPLLVDRFIERVRAATGKALSGVSDEAMDALFDYDWPGNVRELRSAIEFASLRARGDEIGARDLPPELRVPPSDAPGDDALAAALRQTGGNRTEAARLLGISRATLYRRLKPDDA